MIFSFTKKMTVYDNIQWAEFYWRDNEQCWYCRDGKNSEGFFNNHPDIPREMSEDELTWLVLKYQ